MDKRDQHGQNGLVQEDFPLKSKQLVYISHPSGGKEENTKEIEYIIEELYKDDELFDKCCFVSPVHCYGFMYDTYETNYLKGLQFCLDLLMHCDKMIVFGDHRSSRGCTREIEVANTLGKKYLCFEDVSDMYAIIREIKNSL